MKTLTTWFYRLTMNDFNEKVKNAKQTRRMILASTKGSIEHFYNVDGEQIRGYSNAVIRSRIAYHPLIEKYQ
jgi:hypothetical protein